MQSAALEALGLGGEWSYEAIDVPPAELERLTRELPGRGFVGANVTIPHKQAALALADEASEAASGIGAANTLSFSDGRVLAENTDAPGLVGALDRELAGTSALVLGAGGSARAAAWALAGEGASVAVWNRTQQRAEQLVGDLTANEAGGPGGEPALRAVDADEARAGAFALFVNCTAVGLGGEADPLSHLPIEAERLRGAALVDLVYGHMETELVRVAREQGAEVIDGLEVLVRQGAESLRIWTGRQAPLDVMRKAARAEPGSDG
jgi:shikimate dehydrogenase